MNNDKLIEYIKVGAELLKQDTKAAEQWFRTLLEELKSKSVTTEINTATDGKTHSPVCELCVCE
jgi:hypothetical protein